MLKLSVVLCTYNGERYIEEQLSSILNQHRLPDEIVIVDDNSSDSTVKMIKEFFSKNLFDNVFIYENETNLGFKENFKKALSLSSGDVVLLCDQDDVWCPDKTETVANVFSDDSVLGLCGGFSFIDKNGENKDSDELPLGTYGFVGKEPKSVASNIPLKEIMHRNICPGCACAYRREAVDKYLSFADTSLPHDYQLTAISACLSGLTFYNRPLTLYRIHEDNTLGLKGLTQTRLQIAKEKRDLSLVLKDVNKTGELLYNLCEKRLKALTKKSLLSVISLFFIKEYYKYYSAKEHLGDIIYTLKKQ